MPVLDFSDRAHHNELTNFKGETRRGYNSDQEITLYWGTKMLMLYPIVEAYTISAQEKNH